MKKILLPLLALGLAALICVATGAFTSVSAVRAAEVNVVGDRNALLTLTPYNGPNGAYFVDGNGDGAYELALSSDHRGINVNATIVLHDVFTITNNGTQQVRVTITGIGDHTSNISFGSLDTGMTLGVGQSVTVSVRIDTHGLTDGDRILDSIIISAEA